LYLLGGTGQDRVSSIGKPAMRSALVLACFTLFATPLQGAASAPTAVDRCPTNAAGVKALAGKLTVTRKSDGMIEFDPSAVRALGVKPTRMRVRYSGDRVRMLEIWLPADGSYLTNFQNGAPGVAECEDGECWWELPAGTAAKGQLTVAGLNGNASDGPLFVCKYETGE
jgi:hypothetical protein